MAMAGIGQVDDLATLSTLDERTLLAEIQARYQRGIIYTYIGDILVAVNPYRPLPIYDSEHAQLYSAVSVRSRLPPHIFYVSDASYSRMQLTGRNQCCVVSGESGAGKTESTKLLVQHIAKLCKHDSSDLHERIVQVNPLLEAFGNAQTVMNNNSSRFGKFIELRFDPNGKILGAKISEYLLEKSRVISTGPGERNFHIFYYMFSGLTPEQLKNNLLYRPENHRILRPADGSRIFLSDEDFRYNQEMWDRLRRIMDVVGFTVEDVNGILAILAAILHITDIEFEEDRDIDGVFIRNEAMLEMSAQLLGVFPEELAAALISNVHHVRGERIVTLKNMGQANDGRDALAKVLYGRLFGWIVRQINIMLQPDIHRNQPGPTIGILDIAGFENFETNSFEQLCINTANEQLQFYFNQHIFQWELDEYRKEGVKGKDIKFVDNRHIIDLFLETPLGIYSLIDEESRFPRGSDMSLLDKLAKNCAKKSGFSKDRGNRGNFTVQHYAGPVVYNVNGVLEKNKDTVSWNILDCMKNSESQFVSDLFFAPISSTGSLLKNLDAPKRSRKSLLLCKPPDLSRSNQKSLSKAAGKKLKEKARQGSGIDNVYENAVRTQSMAFKSSLTDLMAKLLEGDPHFIRCIKPNVVKMPSCFIPELVNDQLRYTGVLETVKIRRMGYATRLPKEEFVERYRYIAFPLTGPRVEPTNSNLQKILKKAELKDWEMGKTKVFLKYWHLEQLNLHLDRISWQVVDCQRIIRGYLGRLRMSRFRQVALAQQQAVLGFCAFVGHTSDERFYVMARAQDHDAHQQQKMLEEKEENIRKAQEQLKNRVGPGCSRESRERQGPRKGVFLPTPIILGNPVYGNPDPVTSNPNIAQSSSSSVYIARGVGETTPPATGPKPGLRRIPVTPPVSTEYEYQTHTMLSANNTNGRHSNNFNNGRNNNNNGSSSSNSGTLRSDYSHTENSTAHLARRHPNARALGPMSPIGNGNSQAFFKQQMNQALDKLPSSDQEIWAKVLYIEKNQVVAKISVREWEIIIDDSKQPFDGKVMGIRAFSNPHRDANTNSVIKKIGKGIQLSRDAAGNIYGKRQTDTDIVCKGYKTPEDWCYSAQIIENLGRLQCKVPLKIFDMTEYKSQIALEIQKDVIDEERLHLLSMASFAFDRNTFDDMETPCWVLVINYAALDVLGSERILDEVKSLAHLDLSDTEDVQLRRNWARMHQSRDTGNKMARTKQERYASVHHALQNEREAEKENGGAVGGSSNHRTSTGSLGSSTTSGGSGGPPPTSPKPVFYKEQEEDIYDNAMSPPVESPTSPLQRERLERVEKKNWAKRRTEGLGDA